MMDGRTTNWAKRVGDLASSAVMKTYNRILSRVFKQNLVWYTTKDELVCPVCKPMHGTKFRASWTKDVLPAHIECRCTWVTEKEFKKNER